MHVLLLLLQHGSVDDVLAVYGHQQQMYGFASLGVQTTLIHALLKAHGRGAPGNLLAYEAWASMRASGRQLDAQALLAGGQQRPAPATTLLACMHAWGVCVCACCQSSCWRTGYCAPPCALLTSSRLTLLPLLLLLAQACTRACV
jgi:hypothetical protein